MFEWPNFEQSISRKEILIGQSYYQNGQIQETRLLGKGKFRCFIVENDYDNDEVEYSVKIKILNNKVIECNFKCLHRESPGCPHIIAALFEIRHILVNQIIRDEDEDEDEDEDIFV